MTATTVVRTQDEIVARIQEVSGRDWLGTETADLLDPLDFEHARQFLKADTTAEQWAEAGAEVKPVYDQARDYLKFAMGKASGHRGISADRSINHYRAWTWLLGVDEQIDWDNFQNYGAPILQQIAEVMGWQDIWTEHTDTGLDRMARGLQCRTDDDPWSPCQDGCSS